MKVVILAGGYGTRMAEYCKGIPKPMVEIGGMPILWHIMKEYSYYGFNDFVICAGYMQHVIKKWFSDYFVCRNDVTFDYQNGNNEIKIWNNHCETWRVTIIDTRINTMTGGRLKQIRPYLKDETFMLTYGDGVSDVDIRQLVDFHVKQRKCATITVVEMQQKKGVIELDGNDVIAFREKDREDGSLINAGYMVLEPEIFDYIEGNHTVLEEDVLPKLSLDGELNAFKHEGFWHCMDTQTEMKMLDRLVLQDNAPWVKW